MKFKKDKPGLYYQGERVARFYVDAVKVLYQLNTVPLGFCVNTDYEANGYSVIDSRGVQHIYELDPGMFYEKFMEL